MPSRPRQHQLEDESKNAFCSILPPEWLYRDKAKDYGIDGEVEIFDKNGDSTGEIFNVQLKATDQLTKKQALKIRVKLGHIKYWASLTNPTMLVLYTSTDKGIYYKWSHSNLGGKRKLSQKTKTIEFEEKEFWRLSTPQEIVSEIENFRLLRSSYLCLPLNIKLELDNYVRKRISYGELLLYFQKESSERHGLINIFKEQIKPTHGRIIFSKEKTTIYLGGKSSSITYKAVGFDNVKNEDFVKVIADAYTTLGVILAHFGHFAEASSIFSPYYENSSLIDDDMYIHYITVALVISNRFNEFLTFFDHILKKRRLYEHSKKFVTLLYRNINLIHGDARALMLNVFTKLLGASIDHGVKKDIGSNHYNIGNFYQFCKEYRKAMTHYRLAKLYDPDYLSRNYFFRELGAILFELKRYRCSAMAYSKSLKLKHDDNLLPLLADSVMYSGRYQEALNKFRVYMEATNKPEPYWQMKMDVLEYIVGALGIEIQARNTKAAIDCTPKDPDKSEEEAFLEPVKCDALWSSTWLNLGNFAYKNKKFEDALNCFLIAAVLTPGNVEAWANAVLLAVYKRDFPMLQMIIFVSYDINGEAFLRAMYRAIDRQEKLPKGFVLELKNALSEVTQSFEPVKKQKSEFTVRIIEDSRVDIFEFDRQGSPIKTC